MNNAINGIDRVRDLALATAAVTCAGAIAVLLAACGGADNDADSKAAHTPRDATPPAKAASADPKDGGARTRQGRYLTGEQAQALARQVDGRLVRVTAQCCGLDMLEIDVGLAIATQVAEDLRNDAPFIVSGLDLRQAAALANRLAELGATQVYLVTR